VLRERSFEAIFEIPEDHQLIQVRSKRRGGLLSAEYWGHDEYDANGRLVARYESFEEWNTETGASRSGWHKYDETGQLLQVGESLGRPEE
jgi:hypothetical protein